MLKHIDNESREEGINVKAMDTLFSKKLKALTCLDESKREDEFKRLLRRLKGIDMKNTHIFLVPELVSECHWTMAIVSFCERCLTQVIYDPQGSLSADNEYGELLGLYFRSGLAANETAIVKRGAKYCFKAEAVFPRQKDAVNCGIFCLVFAKVMTTHFECPVNFSFDTTTARKEIMDGLIKGHIDWSQVLPEIKEYLQVQANPPTEVLLSQDDQVKITCYATWGKGTVKYRWLSTKESYYLHEGGLSFSRTLTINGKK